MVRNTVATRYGGCLFRTLTMTLVVLLIGLLCKPISQTAAAGTFSEVTCFGPNPGKLRMFKYMPDHLSDSAPLVVVLHGCRQSGSTYAVESGWTQYADRWGFVLLLPEQVADNNSIRCFNWYDPNDIARDKGEAASINQMIEKMKADHPINHARVYVTGLSAGGAMTLVMLATYPEQFAGGAVIAGLPYGAASSLAEAGQSMKLGKEMCPSAWGKVVRDATSHGGPWPKLSIWHGTNDARVHPRNATAIMQQWTAVHGIDQKPDIENTINGHRHTVYTDEKGDALVEMYVITGIGHGTPVKPGTGGDCGGRVAPFMFDVGICATYYIGKFWGLDNPDAAAPSANILAPCQGKVVQGLVTVKTQCTDNKGVTAIEFLVDGKRRHHGCGSQWQWDTTQDRNGSHVLVVRAFDAAGNVGMSNPVLVTIKNN